MWVAPGWPGRNFVSWLSSVAARRPAGQQGEGLGYGGGERAAARGCVARFGPDPLLVPPLMGATAGLGRLGGVSSPASISPRTVRDAEPPLDCANFC